MCNPSGAFPAHIPMHHSLHRHHCLLLYEPRRPLRVLRQPRIQIAFTAPRLVTTDYTPQLTLKLTPLPFFSVKSCFIIIYSHTLPRLLVIDFTLQLTVLLIFFFVNRSSFVLISSFTVPKLFITDNAQQLTLLPRSYCRLLELTPLYTIFFFLQLISFSLFSFILALSQDVL